MEPPGPARRTLIPFSRRAADRSNLCWNPRNPRMIVVTSFREPCFRDGEVAAGERVVRLERQRVLAGVGRRGVVAEGVLGGADVVERLGGGGPQLQRVLAGPDAVLVAMGATV